MATIKKNPKLPDYFDLVEGVRTSSALSQIPSIVRQYEAPRVMYFPDLKPEIDFNFWSSVDTDRYKTLKKFITAPRMNGAPVAQGVLQAGDEGAGSWEMLEDDSDERMRRFRKVGVEDEALATEISRHIGSLLDQMLPVYRRLFAEYEFTRNIVCWRLNQIHTENLHLDSYKAELPHHYARLFINLDNQPRIWQTSWRASEVIERAADKIPDQHYRELTANELWAEFNRHVFGRNSLEWWDDQPRHVAFFEPGDVWAVDGRQVAHQIFYGRRAVSIDFFVAPDSMLNPDCHYLRIAETLRQRVLGERGVH